MSLNTFHCGTNCLVLTVKSKLEYTVTGIHIYFFVRVVSLAPVVQTLDSTIHRIKNYPADKYYGNQLRYPLDSDLSGG